MKKIFYLLVLPFTLVNAVEFTVQNNLKESVTVAFMLDKRAPQALQQQNVVVGSGQSKKTSVGNTFMGKTFPITGFVASAKDYTAQYLIPQDKLNKNIFVGIKPAPTGKSLIFDVR